MLGFFNVGVGRNYVGKFFLFCGYFGKIRVFFFLVINKLKL